jgi:hypothetical protein
LTTDPEQLAAVARSWLALASDHETRHTNAELMVREHRRTVAPAEQNASHMAQQAEQADHHADQAEEAALRDFIVGRLPNAIGIAYTELLDWVDSVNTKMESASASSGVGVRVKVSLRDDLTHTQRTVYHLACKKSAATRTPEQETELATVLKSLLDAADGETDTEKVKQAVDIRDWVRVDYFVHRPGQEPKRWTRNTGLSGGERRLVILAPMIASIAALYDNLPDAALRRAAPRRARRSARRGRRNRT